MVEVEERKFMHLLYWNISKHFKSSLYNFLYLHVCAMHFFREICDVYPIVSVTFNRILHIYVLNIISNIISRRQENKNLVSGWQNLAILKCMWHEIFYWLIRKSFQNDEEWRLFYCDSTLGCRVIQDFDLCKLDDLWRHIEETKSCKTTKNGISLKTFSA